MYSLLHGGFHISACDTPSRNLSRRLCQFHPKLLRHAACNGTGSYLDRRNFCDGLLPHIAFHDAARAPTALKPCPIHPQF